MPPDELLVAADGRERSAEPIGTGQGGRRIEVELSSQRQRDCSHVIALEATRQHRTTWHEEEEWLNDRENPMSCRQKKVRRVARTGLWGVHVNALRELAFYAQSPRSCHLFLLRCC